MRIKLVDGTELNPINIIGGPRFFQESNRDVLTFIFPADVGLEAMDVVFTSENCEKIRIYDEDNVEHIHNGYTIRAELFKGPEEISPSTPDAPAVYEERIRLSMAQRTYAETQMAHLQAAFAAMNEDK